jgi:hypothetical protein
LGLEVGEVVPAGVVLGDVAVEGRVEVGVALPSIRPARLGVRFVVGPLSIALRTGSSLPLMRGDGVPFLRLPTPFSHCWAPQSDVSLEIQLLIRPVPKQTSAMSARSIPSLTARAIAAIEGSWS